MRTDTRTDTCSDDKVLAAAVSSPTHVEIHRHTDLAPHVLCEVEHFFAIYKELEGKRTEVRGWRGLAEAHEVIRQGRERFQARRPGLSEAA